MQSTIRDYVRIARPDHWVKNIFMIPGVALAIALVHGTQPVSVFALALAVVSLCMTASANYTINEYLDAPFDQFHPVKKARPGAAGRLDARGVMFQYVVLLTLGIGSAAFINQAFFVTEVWLAVMGIIYNVPPFRTKDRRYLDVLSESINNPIRFLLGWFAVTGALLPPGSVLLAYWMGGAFLMGTKRYAEYRGIGNPSIAGLYRKSFTTYTEASLLLSSFFYALCAMFLLGVFLIKYRIELILSFPMFAVLFTWYLAISLQPESAAQAPEKLYKQPLFMAFSALTFAVVAVLFYVHIPALEVFMHPVILSLGQ